MDGKKYYKNMDLIRVIACIAVLFYHLNILKGGYLAVCTFFVLSGYLSCMSAFKKEKFSLKDYYLNRLFKIYLPLLIVTFITIFVVSLFPDILWLNLKPETTSVLLGYNNFWQLGANLDYFARHVSSPFMHLWYIAILLQFDLVFPFIYLIFRKIGDKINKIIPCIITVLLSLGFAIYFYIACSNQDIMMVYYDTFTRLFSILFGVSLGFINSYLKPWIPKLLEKRCNIVFYSYLLILIILFIFGDSSSAYFPISMVITSLVTCRLITYSTMNTKKINVFDKIIKSLSSISYEVYLIQYPIIFLFQSLVTINKISETTLIVLLTIAISYFLHFSLNFKNKKYKKTRYVLASIIVLFSLYGGYKFYLEEDHTEEMKRLEQLLADNEKASLEKQKEYEEKLKQEQTAWMEVLNDLKVGEEEIKKVVKNLPIVGIGDSVLLGAEPVLYQTFPNGYFDGKVSRTAYEAESIIYSLISRNSFGGPVVFHLGTNGDCSMSCKEKIVELCGDREVFWLTVTNDSSVHFNHKLDDLNNKYSNFHIIDWENISKEHKEYFYSDKIHLTESGREAYSKAIYNAIYKIYLDEYNKKKEEILNKHEEELKNKISFYGSEMLLNTYDYIQKDFSNSKFTIENFNFDDLKLKLENDKKDNNLTHKLVFVLDNLTEEEYNELVDLLDGHEIYLILTDRTIKSIENVTIVDFYKEIKSHTEYLMADRVHLTDNGKIMLSKSIKEALINNK